MKVFVLAIVIAFLCVTVKFYKPEYALLCQLCGVAAVVIYSLSYFNGIWDALSDMISASGLDASFLKILIKALGVSVITDIVSSVCRDSSNNTLANVVELFGKTVIIVMGLPILTKLAEAAVGFIK